MSRKERLRREREKEISPHDGNFRRERERERERERNRKTFPPASPRDGISDVRERMRGRERNKSLLVTEISIARRGGRKSLSYSLFVARERLFLLPLLTMEFPSREREREEKRDCVRERDARAGRLHPFLRFS